MTAYIARIKPDWLRQLIWIFYFYPFVYLDLWWNFRKSMSLDNMIRAAWDLGWHGIEDKQ